MIVILVILLLVAAGLGALLGASWMLEQIDALYREGLRDGVRIGSIESPYRCGSWRDYWWRMGVRAQEERQAKHATNRYTAELAERLNCMAATTADDEQTMVWTRTGGQHGG